LVHNLFRKISENSTTPPSVASHRKQPIKAKLICLLFKSFHFFELKKAILTNVHAYVWTCKKFPLRNHGNQLGKYFKRIFETNIKTKHLKHIRVTWLGEILPLRLLITFGSF
jgi:hypothetical protein